MTMALNSSWMSEKAGCRSLVKEEPKTGWRIDFFALPDRNDIVENLLENAKIDRFFQRAQRSAHPFAELCGIGGYENKPLPMPIACRRLCLRIHDRDREPPPLFRQL